ncbi:MAG: hypothetical protein SH819_06720 [Cytophagales bacterium]|nr:hypothetical protein [Cytophagales bacterium]
MKVALASLLVISGYLSAAQDYVVTLKQDTVRGRVTITPFAAIDKIFISGDTRKSNFTALTVSAVVLDGATYNPVHVPDGYRLLKLVKPGLLSLYLGRLGPGQLYEVPILVKKTGQALEVPNLRFKKHVSDFLADCPTLKLTIDEEDLGKRDINRIIDEYNSCLERQTRNSFAADGPKNATLRGLSEFQEKLRKDSLLSSNMTDILEDIRTKVKEGKAIPNYLSESVRAMLKDHPLYLHEFNTILESEKK